MEGWSPRSFRDADRQAENAKWKAVRAANNGKKTALLAAKLKIDLSKPPITSRFRVDEILNAMRTVIARVVLK